MLRRLLLLAVLAGIAGLGIFWWLTMPAVIASSALPAYTPSLANGPQRSMPADVPPATRCRTSRIA
jgi:hypothetical protein